MKTMIVTLMLGVACMVQAARPVTYQRQDSLRIVSLLRQGRQQPCGTCMPLYFAHELAGTPYVASTLEVNSREQLVVNTRELDCTTFVETVMALVLTCRDGSIRFDDYCRRLTQIRYGGGRLEDYASRNHYFSEWILSNEHQELVHEVGLEGTPPFTAVQRLDLHYMSQHPDKYAMLKDDRAMQQKIAAKEQQMKGKVVRYIPVKALQGKGVCPASVRDGDILAIVTKKDGLDTSHIGLAVWQDGQLHLYNASSIHKKVVLEPMTLYEYMTHHPSQLGIRVVRLI